MWVAEAKNNLFLQRIPTKIEIINRQGQIQIINLILLVVYENDNETCNAKDEIK